MLTVDADNADPARQYAGGADRRLGALRAEIPDGQDDAGGGRAGGLGLRHGAGGAELARGQLPGACRSSSHAPAEGWRSRQAWQPEGETLSRRAKMRMGNWAWFALMNSKTRTGSCPSRTRPPLPRCRAPGAGGDFRGEAWPVPRCRLCSADQACDQYWRRPGAPNRGWCPTRALTPSQVPMRPARATTFEYLATKSWRAGRPVSPFHETSPVEVSGCPRQRGNSNSTQRRARGADEDRRTTSSMGNWTRRSLASPLRRSRIRPAASAPIRAVGM